MKVKIPFKPEFKDALLNGDKICTCRTKIMGRPGDRFTAYGQEFVITKLQSISLIIVKLSYWKDEGCTSPEHFEQIWASIHPRKKFNPLQVVHMHTFKHHAR